MRGLWASVIALMIAGACGDDEPSDAPPVISSALDLSTMEDTAGMLAIDARDPDGLAVTVAVSTAPLHGTATISNKTLTYTPAANFHGADTLGVTVSDGVKSTVAVVSVSVTAVNDAPTATADSDSTQEDVLLVLSGTALVANDTDPDGDALTVTAVSGATGGTVNLAGGNVSFTPTLNSSGAASFTYTVSDGTLQATATVAVSVSAVNDPPVAVDDTALTAEEVPVMITAASLAGNDTDADGQTPMVVAVMDSTGGIAVLASGIVTFSPALDFNGAGGFDYTTSDGSATDTGHVVVTMTPVEDPPVAVDDTDMTPIGTPRMIAAATLLANDTDPDPGDTLTVTGVQNPLNGSVSLAGSTITFTPTPGYVGPAGFDYVLSDATLTDLGAVSVFVTPMCGDSVISVGEMCDDGDLMGSDGCSATCTTETGWSCAGQPSLCTPICNDGLVRGSEPCDDGDLDETDGCTTQCVVGIVCTAAALPGADRFAVIASTGTCYASFDDDQTTFAAAEASCIGLGGHLATVTSAAESAAVGAVHNIAQTPYIGATDDANDTDAVFDWVTDEPWGFTSFAGVEPDDGPANDGECLVLTGVSSTWADVSCTTIGAATGRICELELVACGDGITQTGRGEECDDGGLIAGDGCDPTCLIETLFISEYVEGSSNNKVVEVANPFTIPFDLTANACALKLFSNGSAVATNTLALTGSIAPGDVFVACHTNVSATFSAECDVLNGGVMALNGDDALTLECNATVLDSIGQTGFDPGTEWGALLESTADNTLRRRCGITHGDTNSTDLYDPAATFVGFALDTFGDIGLATCAP